MKKIQNNIIYLDQWKKLKQANGSQKIPESPNTDKAYREAPIFLQDTDNDEDALSGMLIW